MATQATHLWRPSSARVLTLDSFVPVARGSAATATAPAPQAWPMKDPGDVLDYQIDLSPAVVGNDGDSIVTIDVAINPSASGDLTLLSVSADDPRIVLWFGAGVAGVTYTVTLHVGMTSGRQIARDFLLPVIQLATASGGGALLAAPGQAVVTQAGTLSVS